LDEVAPADITDQVTEYFKLNGEAKEEKAEATADDTADDEVEVVSARFVN
jgi:hypothetical protein